MKNRNHSIYAKDRLAVDEKVLHDLMSLGIVGGPTSLSKALGKNTTYWACMRNREYGLNVGSLVLLQTRLVKMLDEADAIRERARLRAALEVVKDAIHEKCRLREIELLG
jgi:hypothetical protein